MVDQEGEIQSAILFEQYSQVECFVQYFTYYRSLRDGPEFIEDSDFWDGVSETFLGAGTLAWCNVFGSCKSDLHWSKLVENTPEKVEQNFRNRVYKSTGLNEKNYKSLRDYIKTLRDKYVAHRDRDWQEHVWNSPDFKNALKIAKVHECCVNDLLQKESSASINSLTDIIKNAEEEVKHVTALLSSQKR